MESSFWSKTYGMVATFFSSFRDAIFGRKRPHAFDDLDLPKEYIPGENCRFTKSQECDFDIRAMKPTPPTYYKRFATYLYSIYERIVLFFFELFGIED
jgi:hypothetical protein